MRGMRWIVFGIVAIIPLWGACTKRPALSTGTATTETVAATATPQANVGGTYQVVGKNPGGQGNYTGELTIERQRNDVYHLHWKTGTEFHGIGFLHGNHFSVGWGDSRGAYGIIVYTVQPTGVLQGNWTMSDGKELGTNLGTETATPVIK